MLAGPLTTSELLTRAAAEDVDRPAHYLLAAAAMNRLVTGELVMAGTAAAFIHTGTASGGPIALIGRLALRDGDRLARAGFMNEGDVLVHHRGRSVLEFTISRPIGDFLKAPTRFEIAGVGVPVLSTTDLMLERLVDALAGTSADWEQVGHLAVSTRLTVDWPRLHERAVAMAADRSFTDLPGRVETFAALAR
jgi:hypothetical protein